MLRFRLVKANGKVFYDVNEIKHLFQPSVLLSLYEKQQRNEKTTPIDVQASS